MPKLPSKRNLVILLCIWAVVLYARHSISSGTYPGPRGGVVRRGTVTGGAEGGVSLKVTSPRSDLDEVGATYSPVAGGAQRLSPGRRVFVEMHDGGPATVVGFVRDESMLYLAGLFLSLFVLVGGERAAGSAAGLIAAFGGTLFVLVPMIAGGVDPLLATVVTWAGLAVIISLLVSGIHRRTLAIVAGCAGGLIITCGLSVIASSALRMTGVYSALTQDLWYSGAGGIDFVKLLSAGITLGALGVVIDLATAVASAVFEVADVDPTMSRKDLALSGLRVGRDVMGTELNTLVFAYAGARVGLLLLPFFGPKGYRLPVIQVLSLQSFAAEVAHIAVGTAGLILTIPLTALLAGLIAPGGRTPTPGATAAAPAPRAERALWPVAVGCWTALAGIALWAHGEAYHTYATNSAAKAVVRLVQARVLAVDRPPAGFATRATAERKQTVTARLLSGPEADTQMTIHNPVSGFPGSDKIARPGDRLLVKTIAGKGQMVASILDYDRGGSLIVVVWAVGLLVMAVGGRNGLRAMGALALCAPVLGMGLYLIGAHGFPALPVLTAAALLMCGAVFVVLAGPTRKAACAAGGAFGGIVAGGICAAVAGSVMGFTGLQSDSLFAIRIFGGGGELDYKGLLSAGILLGIVGVAMDVAIAVASSAEEIASAKPRAGRAELWRRGMSVGRKVMCTMVLALVFAYLGANMALLILPRVIEDTPLVQALNNDRFACEQLRILAGGIGVVAAIPATAFLSSILIRKRTPRSKR